MWGLLGMGFAGAVVVGVGGVQSGDGSSSGLWWSLAAAVGSGLYLPFAVRAMDTAGRGGSGVSGSVRVTFVVMSVANAAILVSAVVVLLVSGQGLTIPSTGASWLLCGVIGVGVYLVAEVLWSYVFSQEPSLSAPLPYLVPVLSVIAVALILGTNVSWYSVVGMVMVLVANVAIRLCGED